MHKFGKFGTSSLGISKFSLTTILALAALASLVLLSASSVHAAGGSAVVTTDQSDYVAGSTVSIFGSGYATTASVAVTVTDPDGVPTGWQVTSDSTGAFSTTYVLDHVYGNYNVTAADGFGNFASTTFHDAGEAANLDQCQNGGVGQTPVSCINTNSPGSSCSGGNTCDWVNGNVNGNKAHWREGEFLSYRVTLTGLTVGAHSVVFHYDTVHSGNNAIDYLGSFDNTETTSSTPTTFHANNNNPCHDVLPVSQCTPSAPTSSLVMTNPTLIDCDGASGTPPVLGPATFFPTREFKAWGPSSLVLTSMSYVSQNVLSGSGQCTTTVQLNFNLTSTSAGSTVVIAWGGHIACACDWGVGHSASAISGSPYHMALDTLDGASTGSQDRALATTAVFFAPLISTTIRTSNGTAVTSVTSGTVVHDTATLTGASPTAGGSVTYHLFTTNTCTGSEVSSWPKTVTVTNGIIPNSATFTTTTGQFSFQAFYSGDAQNLPATSGCEPLSVGSNVPHLTTSAQTPVTLAPSGSPQVNATDTATITGGTNPTGTITFTVFNNAACSGSPVFTSSPVNVSGVGSYTSPPFTPTAAGTYYWIAAYSGDGNNSPVSTACGDSGEILVVNPVGQPPLSLTTLVSPSSITVGSSAVDTATLSGGFNPTGSIIFQVFQGICGGPVVFTSTVPVSGNGNYASASFTPPSPGTYFWVATYTGDSNNSPIASPCNATGETLTVGNMSKTDTCQTATAGKPFTCTATVTGGTAPYTFTWTLPTGCTGSSTNKTISVTCSTKGSYTISDTVTDSVGNTASASTTVTVTPQPLVVTVTCPSSGLTAGKVFSCSVSATGGTSPYTGTGSFQVTQPVKGTFTETFSVTDANHITASGSTSVTIAPQPLVVTVTCGVPGSPITAGKPFQCTVSASGGTNPYTGTGTFTVSQPVKGTFTESFSVTDVNGASATGSASVTVSAQPLVVNVTCPSSGLTAGKAFDCTVSATGGTAPYGGTGNFIVTKPVKGTYIEEFVVTDANSASASGSATVTIAAQPLVVTVNCPSSGVTAGKSFTCTVSATGGTGPYTGTGDFTVTQPVKGIFTETFTVSDSNGKSASGSTSVTVSPQPLIVTVTCGSSAAITAGKAFDCNVSATGGTAPYGGTGVFSVTESVKGTFTESFSVTDANGVTATGSASVTVVPQPLVVTVACGAAGTPITAGKPFNCTVSATGGTTPYSGTGTFIVNEPVKGTFTESFTVTDANGADATGSVSVTVVAQPLIVTVNCASGATAGKSFSCTVSATGGTSPYTGTGSFVVTEPVKGSFSESFSVTDSNGVIATGSASVTVAPQPLVVTVSCVSGATAGKPFDCTVSATGGTQPYSGTGTFSVTEPVKGTFTESFTVTDANGVGATGSDIVNVSPQPLVVTVTCESISSDTAGKPFPCTVSATGGTQPYSGTGTFTVTQPVKGAFTESFSVTDANGITATGSTGVIIAPQPLIVTVDCGSGQTSGKPFNCSVSATGGTSPYSGTGTFIVTEPVKGTFTESFTVTDANGVTATGSAIVTVAPQPLVVTADCGSGQTAGKPFECTVSATGGTAPYGGTGVFSVIESVKGTFAESFTVTDANGASATASTSVTVVAQPLVVTVTCGTPGAPITAGKPFSCTVSATGGTTPYSGTGSFSLTEQVKGSFTETFSVTDANGVTASGSASVTVAPQPLVVTVNCPSGLTAGKPFSCTYSATGGTAPYTSTGTSFVSPTKGAYTVPIFVTDANGVTSLGTTTVTIAPQPLVVTVSCDSGATAGKPFSCTISATGGTSPYTGTGTFIVTEPVKGTFAETFTVKDANGVSASGSATVTVSPQPLVITVTCDTGATAGKPFSCIVSATGGTQPYSGTGSFTVTQPVKGTFTESFSVTDSNGVTASGSASVTVAPQPLIVTVACQFAGADTAGKPFNCIVSATGGTEPYTGTGTFSVTEQVKGTYTETFSVTDANGVSASGSDIVTVSPQPLVVTVTCDTGATAGKPFSCTVSATGGTSPYTGTGTFIVTEPVKGTFAETFTVTDANGVSASGSIPVTVAPQPLVVTVTCESGATAGKPFNCNVSATGGTAPYTGIGSFSTTEPVKGTFTETFSVTDANGVTASGSAIVTVAPQPLVVTVTCDTSATAGKPFSCTVSATGGTSPYTGTGSFSMTEPVKGTFTESFSVTDANGMTASGSASVDVAPQPLVVTVKCFSAATDTAGKPLNCIVSATGGTQPYSGTGTISVTHQVKGTYTETFSVTDANGVSASGSDIVVVSPQPLVVTASCDGGATAGKPFSCTVSATGGTSPYTGTGTFSITEPVKGTFTESFTVTDANGLSATGSASVIVVPQPLVVTVSCPSGLTAGKPFTCTYSATGGTAPYTSTGTSFDAPTKGAYPVPIFVTDANGITSLGTTTVTIAPQPLVVTVSCDSGATAGKPFSCTVSATGGTSPYSGTGTFIITESVKGTFTESFSVTDANGVSATGSASVTVDPQPLVVTVTCTSGATAGKPFTCIVSATGGTQPYAGTGVFSVTEPTKGSFTETFSVTDANGISASGSAGVTVSAQPLVVTVTCDTGVTAGKPFSCTVSATGGTSPYGGTGTFSVTQPVKGTFTETFDVTDANGASAAGSASVTVAPQPLVVTVNCGSGQTAGKPFSCTISATGGTSPYSGTGTFSMTEPVKGTFAESFTVTDANGVSATGSASVTIAAQPLVVTVNCGSGATAGKPFTCTVSATGGTSPYAGTGSFTVTQPVKGTFTETFRVTDANGASASASTTVSVAGQPFTVTVNCPSTATAGKPFTCTVSATGGTSPYAGTGSFTITHPVKGAFTENFNVTDANGVSAVASATVTVSAQPLVVTVNCSSFATAGKPFICTVSATGGTGPYNGTGNFTLTQPLKGTFTETFTVKDANGATASESATVTVSPQPLVIIVTCPTSGITAGKPFTCSVSATGGTPPYSGTGNFTVTERVKGTFTLSYTVTDSNGVSVTGSTTVIVRPQPLVANFTSVCSGPATVFTATASGGTPPYSYSWSFGDNTTGTGNPVSHTYMSFNTFTATLTVTDANGVRTTVTETVKGCGVPVVVTDTSFCTLPNNNLVLIFITDPANPSAFKLVGSNPGQFYDNVFYNAAPGSPVSLNIQVPFPFITQGANPIQVSSSFTTTSSGCFVPSFDNPSGFTITAPGPMSSSGHPTIVLSNYSPQNFNSTVTVTVTGNVPASGLVYVTIHLDYGLKGTTGWTKGVAQGSTFQALNTGLGLTLNNGQSYTFSVSGSESFTASVTSSNVFKKDPGFAGFVHDQNGTPIVGAKVKIYDNHNNLLGVVYTDQNGVYLFVYKYTGTKVQFTISVTYGNVTQTATVQVQSNKLVEQDFQFLV